MYIILFINTEFTINSTITCAHICFLHKAYHSFLALRSASRFFSTIFIFIFSILNRKINIKKHK